MQRCDKVTLGTGISENTKLYRYITFSQFVSLVEKRQVYLTRITNWNDPWEAALEKVPTLMDDGTPKLPLYSHHMDTFGQCWTLKEESEAMWNIYSPNRDGVKIKTSASKIFSIEGLTQGILAKVEYTDYKTIVVPENEKFGTMLLKRKAFEHEEEVRLLVNANFYQGVNYRDSNLCFDIDPIDFIEEIVVDPRANDWLVDAIKLYCKRVGFRFGVNKSDLLSFDPFSSLKVYRKWVPVSE